MTLRKALNKTSAELDQSGLFSTRQIVDALYGSLAVEKLATQKSLGESWNWKTPSPQRAS
jgi:hypothetical protein